MCRASFLVLLVLVAGSTCPGQTLKGTVKKLDLEQGTLSVRPFFQEDLRDLSLAAKDIPVSDAIGQPALLKDVQVGSRVVLKVEGEFVTGVTFHGPSIWGYLRKVDPDKRTVEIEDPVRTHTVTLPQKASVLLDGVAKSLRELKLDQPAQVLYTPDEKTPLQLLTGRAISPRDPYRKLKQLPGVLLESDAASRTLSVLLRPSGEPMQIATMTTTPNVAVRIEFNQRKVRNAQLAELKTGPLTVNLIIDHETQRVDGIVVDSPGYTRRKLLELDLEKRTITIEELKTTRTLVLDPEVVVSFPNGPGKLVDLKVGKTVTCGLSPDRSRVIVLQASSR